MADWRGLAQRRLVAALRYSLNGLRAGLRHEEALRVELVLVCALAPLGLWLGRNGSEKALLVSVLVLVLIVELLNSAVEAVVDRVGIELHELSGRAKDLGSAAVMLSLLLVPLVWGLVLWG